MQLPKPLLILVVVLIVLAVIGTGAAFLGPDGDQDDAQGGLSDFLDGLIPDPDPIALNTTTAPCLNPATDNLEIPFNTVCTVQVLPADTLRRELELQVTQGNIRFDVDQRVGGEDVESDPEDVPFVDDDGQLQRTVSVVVSRDDSARLRLGCRGPGDCLVLVNP
jgi:hypothetical protein